MLLFVKAYIFKFICWDHPHRHFNLRMRRDTRLFSEDFKLDLSGEETAYDTSHIYTGELYGRTRQDLCHFYKACAAALYERLCDSLQAFLIQQCINLFSPSGEQGSVTHGSVVDGKFEGFINTQQGTYYVEPTERYLGDKNVPFHSVIYHEDDIGENYVIIYNKTLQVHK